MTDMITRLNVRQDDHDSVAADIARFEASGGKIERLPGFAMAEANWTPRQAVQSVTSASTAAKVERNAAQQAEREAKKAAEAAKPLTSAWTEPPIGVRPRREPTPKAKKPGDKRVACRPGTKTGELLALLKANGQMTVAMIYAAKELEGWERPHIYARLDSLQEQGLVRCIGILRRPGVKPAQGYEAVPDAAAG